MIGHADGTAASIVSGAALRAPRELGFDDWLQATGLRSRGPSLEVDAGTLGRVREFTPIPGTAKWAWGLREMVPTEGFLDGTARSSDPRPGDVVVVRVDSVGYHAAIVTRDNRKLRIYPGDLLVGLLGNRYATDAYEAEVEGLERLSLLTAGGMVGTVRSSHKDMPKPTSVSFVGYAVDAYGGRLNLKERLFRPAATAADPGGPLLVVVGTGMNSGKTTVVSQILHGLGRQGVRAAAAKITGSVSNRDTDEMRAADAISVLDFSDYGFPSTYLADPKELALLRRTILADGERARPQLTVVEIADGVLERETALILRDPAFRRLVAGVVLTADSSLAALAGVEELRTQGYPVVGVSGAFTSAPLYVREFQRRSDVPVLSSAKAGTDLAAKVLDRLILPDGPAPSSTAALSGTAEALWSSPPGTEG